MVNDFYFEFIILNFVDFRLIITCFEILRYTRSHRFSIKTIRGGIGEHAPGPP